MPQLKMTVSCPVHHSFRVKQIGGLFNVPLEEKIRESFSVEVPDLNDDWNIGLIVGPSGSGKTTVARQIFKGSFYLGGSWPHDKAVIDAFPQNFSIKEITGMFTSVGFSSPPSWIKPYHVLSNGERFRCDLALALSQGSDGEIVAFDEFTSVVDRDVARVTSATISKGIQNHLIPKRFVAITCHYDIISWLQPQWILDMASGTFSRRRLRRPRIQLEIVRCRREAWKLFARHHYLSGSLAPACRTYMALWEGKPVSFCGILPVVCKKGHWRFSRVVTLPDFQGMGIGMRFIESIAEMYIENHERINITGSHPAVIAHCKKSPLWKTVNVSQAKNRPVHSPVFGYRGADSRIVVSFEYTGRKITK
ncbi:MAG: GNAT family N-acetyltransferase [Planctomycetia bacterium]|nr:GNAT family N-acetyltransferase [Planctomycetia bacterium]